MDDAPPRSDRRALERHDLVGIAPADWDHVVSSADLTGFGPPAIACIRGWADRGWPAVARRRSAADKADTVPLGLPLPPRLGKLRLAVSVPLGVISAPIDPPSLADVADVAPSRWRPTVAALLAVGACFGLVPRPFGSLLWQALTGMPYVGPRSDIDVLWPLRVGTDVAGLVEALSGVAHASPVAIDGELLWAGEGAQWREYGEALRDGGEVLVKRLDGVSLRRVTAAASSGTARAPWEGLPSP